jgi:hypothetical protein
VKLTISTWGPRTPIHVVIADLCEAAVDQIVGNANIATLQNYVVTDAALSRALSKLGRTPADVIGLNRVGTKVTLYIL